jgi:hypothetical protein
MNPSSGRRQWIGEARIAIQNHEGSNLVKGHGEHVVQHEGELYGFGGRVRFWWSGAVLTFQPDGATVRKDCSFRGRA